MRWLDRFRRDETGSVTIEFVLWVPVIVALVVLVVDATTLYVTHTEMWNVARNVARQMTTGVIANETDAETCAANGMRLRSEYPYFVDAEYNSGTDTATVIVALRVNDMSIMGSSLLFSPLTILGGDMTARVVMRMDPNSSFGSGVSAADCLADGGDPGNDPGNPGDKDKPDNPNKPPK